MFSLVSLLIISCSKEDPISSGEMIPDSIIPFTVGNYWIYQSYLEDENGVLQPKSSTDSMYIESSQMINGIEYFNVNNYSVASSNVTTVLRDSLGYLVNDSGQIVYSPNDDGGVLFENVLPYHDEANIYISYSLESTVSLDTPAGTFETKKIVGDVDFSETNFECDKQNLAYYADGVGRVREDLFFASSCNVLYRELLRYNIQ